MIVPVRVRVRDLTVYAAPVPLLMPRGSALQLALLRIVAPAMVLTTVEVRQAPRFAMLPPALRVAPEGLGWFVTHVPITPAVATAVQAVCVFSALCAIVGLRARIALIAVTLASFYLLALGQLSGAVWHDMHLVWMPALLAASPCDEALAYDHRGRPLAVDSPRYGLPLTFARLLLGCIYFFPGFHKLHTSGLAWALSDNLRNQIWIKWAEHGVRDSVRFDQMPLLLRAGGLFVLAFELSFPVLALLPRTRPWIAGLGLVFHALAGFVLRIPFVSLWALYVILVDPRVVCRALHVALPTPTPSLPTQPPLPATGLVGAVLLTGAIVQGARGQMRSFPFACYPTFEWIAGTEIPDLLLEADGANGGTVLLPHARDANGYRTQRQWGQIWGLAGVGTPLDSQRLRAYVMQTLQDPRVSSLARGAVRVRCWRAFDSVVPGHLDDPPRRDALIAEIPLTR